MANDITDECESCRARVNFADSAANEHSRNVEGGASCLHFSGEDMSSESSSVSDFNVPLFHLFAAPLLLLGIARIRECEIRPRSK